MSLPLLAAVLRSGADDLSAPERARKQAEPARVNESRADDRLVERIRGGDTSVYETLFRSYFSPLSDFAESVVGSPDAAEELVQDVLWSVWERRESWHVTGSIRAYLFSAVRYRALNDLRNRRFRQSAADRLAHDDVVRPSAAQIPDARVEHEELARHLRHAIAQLSPARRETLTLRWDHGLSYAEVAAVVGSSVKAVENQLNRTLKQLREQLTHLRS